MDDEFWNYFMNYKHCIYELLLFYMKFYVIFINHNASYDWYNLYDVI